MRWHIRFNQKSHQKRSPCKIRETIVIRVCFRTDNFYKHGFNITLLTRKKNVARNFFIKIYNDIIFCIRFTVSTETP